MENPRFAQQSLELDQGEADSEHSEHQNAKLEKKLTLRDLYSSMVSPHSADASPNDAEPNGQVRQKECFFPLF
jgi:hypothetical protein